MVGLKFENFHDLEKKETISGKPKLKRKWVLYGNKKLNRAFQFSECDNSKTCNQFEGEPKINWMSGG